MKGCFAALEPAVPYFIEQNFPLEFPNVHVAQCGECLLAERQSMSSTPDEKIFFFSFFIMFVFFLLRNH